MNRGRPKIYDPPGFMSIQLGGEMKKRLLEFSLASKWTQAEQVREALKLFWKTHPVFKALNVKKPYQEK